MRIWPLVAFVAIVLFAYAFFYLLSSLGGQGSTSFGLANTAGLIAVFTGVAAAVVLLRRASAR
jgi:membrane associated rhomboid family serine protease